MQVLGNIQMGIMMLIQVGVFALTTIAFIDSLRFSDEAYKAIDRHSKALWCIILGVAAALAFVNLPITGGTGGLGLLGIASIVAAGIYLGDMAKKLRAVQPRRDKR